MVLPDDRPVERGHRGRLAERRALQHLLDHGLTLLTKNFQSRFGEIDLVMQHDSDVDRGSIVFVEVRYRHQQGFASAAESVDRHKQGRLTRAAMYYITRNPRVANDPMRFDVVAIDDGEITWIQDAFRPGD